MYIKSLAVRDFRLYETARFEFSPQINYILGPNGSGKSTILEALYLLMVGKSFRSTRLQELIREGASSFYLEAVFVKYGIEQSISFLYEGTKKRILYNKRSTARLSELLGILQGVLMVPDDIALIKGGPKERRAYFDLQLVQLDPLYVHFLSRYQGATKQRNALLKQKSCHTIEVWEEEMARSGAYLICRRNEAVQGLLPHARETLSHLTGCREKLDLSYQSQIEQPGEAQTAGALRCRLQQMRSRELAFGSSLVGPHKDELIICINEKETRHYGSEGQQRSCVVALRFAEWQRAHKYSGIPPIMLIDDIGMSLDCTRMERLNNRLTDLHQVFITTTEKRDGPFAHQITLGARAF